MNPNTFIRIAVVTFLASGSGSALAAEISLVEPGASTVELNGGSAVVRFNVSGTAEPQDHCGYFVDYGDGAAGDSRVIERASGRFTRQHERTFTRPGTYTIKASGKNVKTTPGCNGAASATLTVVSSRADRREERREERRAESAPSCPEGWMLNEKSVSQRTGAFSCSRKPAAQLQCGDGLRYFSRNGMIGCRPGREG